MKKLVCAILTLMMCFGSCAFAAGPERPDVTWDFGVPLSDTLSDYAVLVNRDNLRALACVRSQILHGIHGVFAACG